MSYSMIQAANLAEDRADLAIANRPMINLNHRSNFNSRTTEKDFIGSIEFGAID